MSPQPVSQAPDTLAVFVAKGGDGPVLLDADRLPQEAREHLSDALSQLRVSGKADEVARFTGVPGLAATLVLSAGVGPLPKDESGQQTNGQDDAAEAAQVPLEALRRAAGAAARACGGRKRLGLVAPDERPAAFAAIAQGAALGAYKFTDHRGIKAAEGLAKEAPVPAIDVLADPAADEREEAEAEVAAAATVVARQRWARDLVNMAPNVLYPESFALTVREAAPDSVTVEELDEEELAEGGFGGIVGVGQGSARPPRLVTISYSPADASEETGKLAFVGKGITFDSGGLCIKPGKSMITMKCDMGGAAAVAAAVFAIADLGLPIEVTGYLCLAENMPGDNAQRPGDVVTMRDGQTVEIINTDAEGRLVMADGIALAAETGPDAIIDVATLTGACMVALGTRTAGVFANDDALQGELTSAATASGEAVWPLPITSEIRAGMDSLVADISHMGADMGGAMTAAAFLRNFAGTDADGRPIPWGHLDIAGPAYNDSSPHGYTVKGGTGFATRTLVEFARARSED
nr:leucyl aminopeptidase [Kineosphaera limosa]